MAHDLDRIAARRAVWFGCAGLALAIILVLEMGAKDLLTFWTMQLCIAVGLGGGLYAAYRLGRRFGSQLGGGSWARACLIGAGIALAMLEISTIVGTIFGLTLMPFVRSNFDYAFWSLVTPLFWMNLVGAVPALVLGVAYGCSVHRTARA